MNSMIGLTNASVMFGFQQMQNAWDMFNDSRRVIDRMRHSMDSIADAMNHEMDDENRSNVDRWNRAGMETVNATSDTFSSDESDDQTERDDRDREGAREGGSVEMSASAGTSHSGHQAA